MSEFPFKKIDATHLQIQMKKVEDEPKSISVEKWVMVNSAIKEKSNYENSWANFCVRQTLNS